MKTFSSGGGGNIIFFGKNFFLPTPLWTKDNEQNFQNRDNFQSTPNHNQQPKSKKDQSPSPYIFLFNPTSLAPYHSIQYLSLSSNLSLLTSSTTSHLISSGLLYSYNFSLPFASKPTIFLT